MMQQTFRYSLRESKTIWTQILPPPVLPTERYSHCACFFDKSMYVFGGCTLSNTTFNDLWRFDLATRQWIRPLAMGSYPSPKACASMVVYKDSLVLFGGWSHPTPFPLHQADRFFNELHMYNPESNRWIQLNSVSASVPEPVAGHSVSIVEDRMVVFGGSHVPAAGSNDVWVFDFEYLSWKQQPIAGPRPNMRYGQSQTTIDDKHILILGGCGGPNQIFNDIWLLALGRGDWTWAEVKINNSEFAATQLWCHPVCKVGNTLVILNKPPKSSESVSQTSHQQHIQSNRVLQPAVIPRENQPARYGNREPENQPDSLINRLGKNRLSTSSQQNPGGGFVNREPEYQPRLSVHPPAEHQPGLIAAVNRTPENQPPCQSENRLGGKQLGVAARALHKNPSLGLMDQGGSDLDHRGGTSNLRPGHPSVKPNSMHDRQKQLDLLRKYEERIRQHRSPASSGGQGGVRSLPATCDNSVTTPRESRIPMCLYLLDIGSVAQTQTSTWLCPRETFVCNSVDDRSITIFYSLVEGWGELVLFGGIQMDLSSTQRRMDMSSKSHLVSNNLYVLRACRRRF
ncbi:F-box only protein 42-like isoform X2 [Gigantopelta aegis]|nr:F-box only protein 42-like isoform X2 [Gigantopelta aegis]